MVLWRASQPYQVHRRFSDEGGIKDIIMII
jgi:hypothetical protein